jgi:hypothetical protein
VLIPRYADMEATTTVTTLEKRKLALLIEWRAINPSGKVLWAQTVEAEARKTTGLNHQKLVEMVARDLVAKSTAAIMQSPEIRMFVEALSQK